MSIFEKQSSPKLTVDDTCQLRAVVINSEENNGHTDYIIRVHRGYNSDSSWHVHRRYNDFHALHKELSVAGVSLPLPPKKIIGNMDKEFISQRLRGLQSYLNIVLSNALLANQKAVKIFLDPHTYSNMKDLGVTQISMRLRGETDLKVVKQLSHIGRRLRKEFYFVQSNLSKEEFLLTWSPYGPDKYLDQKKISSIMKSYCELQHPHIASPTKVGVFMDGAWVLRPAKKSGSLLDALHCVKSPLSLSALKKYGGLRKALEPNEICNIASQIVRALIFLHSKGTWHGHLHLGNIMYDDAVVKLTDLENQLLGLPTYYRELVVKSRQIKSVQNIDVYCLGLIIYELVYGVEFDYNNPKDSSYCPPPLRPLLEAIHIKDGMKNGLLELSQTASLEVFQNRLLTTPLPPYLKLSSSSRQEIATNGDKTLERLKSDNLKYREYNRTSKLNEILNDENGKLVLLYETKKGSSKSSCSDSDHPRSEASDGVESPQTPTPSVISEGTADSEEGHTISPVVTDGRSALLGAISGFDKRKLKKVTCSN